MIYLPVQVVIIKITISFVRDARYESPSKGFKMNQNKPK
jgi:hypothetical protein